MSRSCYKLYFTLAILFAGLPLGVEQDARANGVILSEVRPEKDAVVRSEPPRRPIERWMQFDIREQVVNVEVGEAVAETTVEQVFFNRSGAQAEGQYLFPIAEDAGVTNFSMTMNGREMAAELLDADRARQIYQSIVSKMQDPGLLQFAGRGLIQAKVFPVPAGGECRIKLRYTEPVKVDGGLAAYRFPLNSANCQVQPIEKFSLKATFRTQRPLISVFSAAHEFSIDRRSDREVVVGYEGSRMNADNDIQLFAQLGAEPFGVSLLPFREGAEEGYFMARIAPGLHGRDDAVQPKNICFVLDTSGSMADANKIGQAKKALQFCVTNLGREDRFNIITFSTDVRPFRDGWSVAAEADKTAARSFIENLSAVGGTDINAALNRSLQLRPAETSGESWTKNPYLVVFITDGEPTVGVTDPVEILKNVTTGNSNKLARIFSLGVGFQVNTKLLDGLADNNGGARDYVTPTENLEIKISSFYTKLANPILSNLKLAFDGVSVHDVFPREIPDMFEGSELVVVGRYSGMKGPQRIELSGQYRGDRRSFSFPCKFPERETKHAFLPRFWAMRKIGFLLDELRLKGENGEVKNEVIRLAKQYGILTPYTSYLVQEDETLAVREGRTPVGGRKTSLEMGRSMAARKEEAKTAAEGQTAAVGPASATQSRSNWKMRQADCEEANRDMDDVLAANCDSSGQRLMNFVGNQTFYYDTGRWVDSRYDGKAETRKITLYTPEYFEFVTQHAELGASMAQGERVIVRCGEAFIETIPAATGG